MSRREYSQAELRQKLSQVPEVDLGDLEELLRWLAQEGFQSDQRAAEAHCRAHASRKGRLRLQQELRQRGIAPEIADQALAELPDGELYRAAVAWERRFGEPPDTLPEKARQHRFLLARGFSPAVVRQLERQGYRPPSGPESV